MSFVDKVDVTVKAGKGGDGKMSFRHEMYIAKGGPDGGDGGDGGSVILRASRNQNTLTAFRYQKELRAELGHSGGTNRKHGKSGANLIVAVPVGTMVTDSDGIVVADLVVDEQEALVARGGKGGFGNAHFVSSKRQAPNFAEKGEPGDEYDLQLELKMIADVGLVGLPNAGKSTLLSVVSHARPEIADYPFTTLTPNLGVVDIDKKSSVLFADIPGLIEGAAEGKGLGHDFLRHIERTAVILHLIDSYTEDVAKAYLTVREELKAYQPELIKRPEIVALTKIEGLDIEIIDDLKSQIKRVSPKRTKLFALSSKSGEGVKELLYEVQATVIAARNKPAKKAKIPEIPVLTLSDTSDKWEIKKKDGIFIVRGQKIEQFGRRTDFTNEQAVRRLRDIMRRFGIMHELTRLGVKAEQVIQIGNNSESRINY